MIVAAWKWLGWGSAFLALVYLGHGAVQADIAAADGVAFFESKIRPILDQHCYECHASTSKKVRGRLRLDTREGWTKGGAKGGVIVSGKPEASSLIRAVRYDDPELQMPPKGKLQAAEIVALESWIKMGAPDPRNGRGPASPASSRVIDVAAGRRYWAFRPIQPRRPPPVRDDSWCRNPIDPFILAAASRHAASSPTPKPTVGPGSAG